MKLAPIILFTFNRLEHTKKTIRNLKKNELASESELYIFSDGPRNNNEELIVNEVRNYLDGVDGFKKVTVIKSLTNKGLAESVINGVSSIIQEYGKVIVLEDDLLTSKYFLRYMNHSLELFEDREDIWSISGYGPNIKTPENYLENIYLTMRGASWGWATWNDKWEMNDWEISDYREFKNSKEKQKLFNKSGSDMTPMLNDQMEGRINSWAIRWGYNQFKHNLWTVYPINSFVKNIGTDLSGTHSGMTDKYNVEIENKMITINPKIVPNVEIIKEFKVKYDLNALGYTAILIKKIGLYKPARMIRNKMFIFMNLVKRKYKQIG